MQEHGDAQRRHLAQAWDVRTIFLKDPVSVPKVYSQGWGTREKGVKEPQNGHLLWALPSAVVTEGNTSLSPSPLWV